MYLVECRNYVSMPITFNNLSLFCHTHKVDKIHHLVIVECGCMNEFVGDIVNLAKTLENIVQMLVEYPLSILSQNR